LDKAKIFVRFLVAIRELRKKIERDLRADCEFRRTMKGLDQRVSALEGAASKVAPDPSTLVTTIEAFDKARNLVASMNIESAYTSQFANLYSQGATQEQLTRAIGDVIQFNYDRKTLEGFATDANDVGQARQQSSKTAIISRAAVANPSIARQAVIDSKANPFDADNLQDSLLSSINSLESTIKSLDAEISAARSKQPTAKPVRAK
jgi:hypothetical protein